tara:strand:+ start:307 stop:747 length:441 start_codon:yes stop_codon:yes gene_type:complete
MGIVKNDKDNIIFTSEKDISLKEQKAISQFLKNLKIFLGKLMLSLQYEMDLLAEQDEYYDNINTKCIEKIVYSKDNDVAYIYMNDPLTCKVVSETLYSIICNNKNIHSIENIYVDYISPDKTCLEISYLKETMKEIKVSNPKIIVI